MKRFYFTYGTYSGYPFHGGWTEVFAEDIHAAIDAFRAVHPNRRDSRDINCADYYTEESFSQAGGLQHSNLGAHCHEVIICSDYKSGRTLMAFPLT